MSGEDGGGSGSHPRGRRASFAERKERRAAIDDPAVVLEAAARFLEPRARSVTEVRRRLTGAGYRTDLVEGAITRMLELGMLDDEAFARAWVESRDRARPRGERAIRQELGLKGVDRPTIELVLASAARRRPGSRPTTERSRNPRTRRPRSVSWHATPGAWHASRIRVSGASAHTRCSPATASIPTSAARSLPRSNGMTPKTRPRKTEGKHSTLRPGDGSVDPRGGPP